MKIKARLGALVVLLYASSCSNDIKKTIVDEYPVIHPKIQTSNFQNAYVAEINAFENIELRSRVNGVIEEITVNDGEFVQKGQVLVKIESQLFEQELKRAEAQLAARLSDLKAAKIELENAKRLFQKNIISKTELELSEAKESAATANVNESQGNVAQCRLNLSYTKIRAPFAGRINRILLKRGSLISQESLITSISNDQEVFAYFNLNESEYLKWSKSLKEKMPTEVELLLSDGTKYALPGKVELAESEVDRVTGNIALRARFKNPNGILKQGSSGKVIWTQTVENAMLIPKQSTFDVQELIYVYVVDHAGVIKQRSVKIGGQLPQYYIVESGLKTGDLIMLEGVQMVSNYDRIQAKIVSFPEFK